MPLEPYPARSARHLPHAGKALSVGIVFLHVSCIRIDDARKAAFSFRCLPHWGRGTASAVDRVLSQTAYLRQSFPLVFHTASPSNLRPFGAPPSIGRRECPREPIPLEGAAERSEAGLASFFAAKPPPLCLPHRGRGDRVSSARVLSYIVDLRRSFPLSFIPLEPYPARFARHLPHAGKALSVGIVSSTYACICSDNTRKAAFSFRSLPHWGRGTAPAVDRVLSYIVDLKRISPLIFHTARTLSGSLCSPPSPRGEGFVRRYCFSPHMRVFALTMREKRHSRFVAFPIGKGGPRSSG